MAISFPDNASVGDKHTNRHGQSYEAIEKGGIIVWRAIGGRAGETRFSVGSVAPANPAAGDLWHDTVADVLKMWDRDDNSEQWTGVGAKPVVATTAPSNPYDGMMWFNPNELNLYMYITYNGVGKWKILASASLTDTQTIISEVLPLSWLFEAKRFNFELFIDNPDFNFRDITPREIIDGISGDDTIEISSTEGITAGKYYVLYHPDEGLKDIVRVNSRLSGKKLKLYSILSHNYGESNNGIEGAFFAPTSFTIQEGGTAVVRNGDVFFTRVLNGLELWPNGEFAIRRTAAGTGQFKVFYKYPDQTTWLPAPLITTKARGEWRDELYDIRTSGMLDFRIEYANSNNAETETLDFMLLYGATQNSDTLRMERPSNVSPADGASGILATPTLVLSEYRNIFGIDQGGAHYQVALDPNFSQLVVNTSSDDLVAWVAVSGQAAAFNAIVNYDLRKFILAADGGTLRRTTDGGLTFETLTLGETDNIRDIDFNNVDQMMLCGANGLIANSQDNGDNWVTATPAGGYSGQFNGIAANGAIAVTVGTAAEIQRTTNGGSIWNKRPAPNAYAGDYRAVDMANSNIMAVGTLGQIAYSSDGGVNFTKRTPANNFTGTFNAIAMRDDGRAIVVGANGEVQRTEDYGASFQKIVLPDSTTTELKGVAFVGESVVITGVGGEIYSSTDAGISFVLRPAGSGSSANLNAVALDEENYGLIVGAGGAVQRTLRLEGEIGGSFTVPAGADMLQINQVYWWRGKYIDDLGFESEWSIPTAFSTANVFAYVYQPQNLSPANGSVNVPIPPKLQTSAFNTFGQTDTHAATQWQVASDAGFTNLLYNSGDKVADKLEINVPGGIGMLDQGTYFWRARHKGTTLGYSAWSVPTSFRAVNSPAQPTITTPSEAATGVSPNITLVSSAFSTTAIGENHDKSQWQVATNPSFTNLVVDSGQVNNLTSYTVPAGQLNPNTQYYARVRYFGLNTGASAWSGTRSFTTSQVSAPALTAPANNATSVSTVPNLVSSAFDSTGTETHTRSQWQISTVSNFSSLIHDSGEVTSLTSYAVPANANLAGQTQYYARVRHRGANSGLSAWSSANMFTTGQPNIPSLTAPAAGATGQSIKPTLTSSAFSTTVSGDTHEASSWQIASDNAFNNVVSSVTASTASKLSWVSANNLSPNVQYYARVRHHGSASGVSPWSAGISFTTSNANTPSITSPANGATVNTNSPTLTSSAFASSTSETHQSSQWQVATDSGFGNIVINSGEVGNLTSYPTSGLGYNTQYYARVRHRGSLTGWTDWSAARSFNTAVAPGHAIFTTPGTSYWVVPPGVTSVCVVCVSAGVAGSFGSGGYGGSLRYGNNISVVPGQTLPITVGSGGVDYNAQSTSSFSNLVTAVTGNANGGSGGNAGYRGGYGGWGGFQGEGYSPEGRYRSAGAGGGGGAAGYLGNGGDAGKGDFAANQYGMSHDNPPIPPTAGSGGGGGGGGFGGGSSGRTGGNGGGVGLYGVGSSGGAGSNGTGYDNYNRGSPGSNGSPGSGGSGTTYGGGGGGTSIWENGPRNPAGNGAVRIIWGNGRSFPYNAG